MGFDAYGATGESSGNSNVDWEALNKYVVDTCDLEEPETLVGYLVGIIDLGIQPQSDVEMPFTGTAGKEASIIEDYPNTYFKDVKDDKGDKIRLKCFPAKPQQCITYVVDFPQIELDKGQFFGKEEGEELKPLRLYYGGTFYTKEHGNIVGRTVNLRVTKNKDDKWSLASNNMLYKMAVASKTIKSGEPFLPQDIDKLIGKPLQFEIQIGFNKKGYYFEKLNFKGGLTRGMVYDDYDEDKTFMIQFNKENSEEDLGNIRAHIKRTLPIAINFEGSMLERQLSNSSSEPEEPSDEDDGEEDTPLEQEYTEQSIDEPEDEPETSEDDAPPKKTKGKNTDKMPF